MQSRQPTESRIATGPTIGSPSDIPSVCDLKPGLLPVDAALREVWGFGLQAITGTLGQASSWDGPETNGVYVSTSRAVAERAYAVDAKATAKEYKRAVEWLTLTSVDPQQFEPWEIERRADRIASHPFLRHEEGIHILPWSAVASLKIVFNYLEDGRLPWPEETLNRKGEDGLGKVVETLRSYRQSLNRDLENDGVRALETSGLKVLHNVKPGKRHKFGIKELRGEIDILCIDHERSVIWVVEVKDPHSAFSPRSTMRIVHNFHGDDGYVAKLLGKCEDIRASASALAAKQEINQPDRQWDTRGMMATRVVCPAAFVSGSEVEFCTVDKLRAALCG